MEGPQAVRSALDAGVVIHDLFVADDAGAAVSELGQDAQARGVRVTTASASVLAAMGETQHPQGVLAVCDQLAPVDLDLLLQQPAPVVILEGVSDPGNVGTVIRTADAAGAAGVILTAGSADPHNGKVVRATAGSLFHLPVARDVSLDEVLDACRRSGRALAVTTGQGDEDLFEAAAARMVCRKTMWLIGSEAHGASEQALEAADVLVRIPMPGRAESLNAAVAAAVVLYVTAYDVSRRPTNAADSGLAAEG